MRRARPSRPPPRSRRTRASLKTGADVGAAKAVGKLVAERALDKGVTDVVFDRGGYGITAASRRWPMRRAKAGLKF